MSLACARGRPKLPILALTGVLSTLASPALGQESSSPPSEAVAVVSGIDIANQYMFRGVRQTSTGVAVWPFVDLTARVRSGEGSLKRIDLSAGFWNSLHTGDTGSGGPMGQPWYEARFSGALEFLVGGGLSVASGYTAYTSPNELFTTVKEIGIELALDDDGTSGAAALRPVRSCCFRDRYRAGRGSVGRRPQSRKISRAWRGAQVLDQTRHARVSCQSGSQSRQLLRAGRRGPHVRFCQRWCDGKCASRQTITHRPMARSRRRRNTSARRDDEGLQRRRWVNGDCVIWLRPEAMTKCCRAHRPYRPILLPLSSSRRSRHRLRAARSA